MLTSIAGLGFDEAWTRRVMIDVGGRQIPVLSLADLVTNKRATGRKKDLLDVALLEEAGLVASVETRARKARSRIRPKR